MSDARPAVPACEAAISFYSTLLKAVWLSIALGLLIQAAILVSKNVLPGAKVIPEAGQRVTWSVLVCGALAVGNSLARARPLLLGWLGLMSAPAAFGIARAVQKSLAVDGGGGGFPVPSQLELAIMRAVEYGLFGVLIGYAGRTGGLRGYLRAGAMLGTTFAVYHLLRLWTANTPKPPVSEMAARAINEWMFPIGCALILWTTTEVGRRLAAPTDSEPPPIAPA